MVVDKPEFSNHAEIEVRELAHSTFQVVSIYVVAVDVKSVGAENIGMASRRMVLLAVNSPRAKS